MVRVTPEVSSSAVLMVGIGNGPMVLERFDRAGRAGVAPVRGEVRPDQFVVEVAQPRHRDGAGIEQRAEEGAEEHHLREDEPAHRPAEGEVDALAVLAAFGFADGVAEPEVQHHQRWRRCRAG